MKQRLEGFCCLSRGSLPPQAACVGLWACLPWARCLLGVGVRRGSCVEQLDRLSWGLCYARWPGPLLALEGTAPKAGEAPCQARVQG